MVAVCGCARGMSAFCYNFTMRYDRPIYVTSRFIRVTIYWVTRACYRRANSRMYDGGGVGGGVVWWARDGRVIVSRA